LDAARIIAGPPMSMFSIAVSKSAPLRDRRFERVEVHDQQVDRRDRMGRHRGDVLRIVASREQSAMDLGMQRLDAPIHDLGEAGVVGDLDDAMPGIAQRLGGAAGREDLDAVAGEAGRQLQQPRLVRNGDQGAGDLDQVHARDSH
jgi:hypothetical protein